MINTPKFLTFIELAVITPLSSAMTSGGGRIGFQLRVQSRHEIDSAPTATVR
jgi:hypothetical protein